MLHFGISSTSTSRTGLAQHASVGVQRGTRGLPVDAAIAWTADHPVSQPRPYMNRSSKGYRRQGPLIRATFGCSVWSYRKAASCVLGWESLTTRARCQPPRPRSWCCCWRLHWVRLQVETCCRLPLHPTQWQATAPWKAPVHSKVRSRAHKLTSWHADCALTP